MDKIKTKFTYLLENGFVAIFISCLWSYLNVWSINYIHREYMDYFRLSVTFALTLLFANIIFLVIWCCTGLRSANRSFFAAASFMLLFLNFHFFYKFKLISDHVSLYFLLLGGAIVFAYYFSKQANFRKIFVLLPLVGSLIVSLEAFTTSPSIDNRGDVSKLSKAPNKGRVDWTKSEFYNHSGKTKHSPNVYFIIVDSTLRNDAFKRFYDKNDKDYDDFLAYAEKNGFYVVKNAYSNFPVTATSIPSTLNMDFIVWDQHKGPEKIKNRGSMYDTPEYLNAYNTMRGDNAVNAAFRSRGYKIYHTSNGFLPASACAGFEDECIKKKGMYLITQQELSLIKMTPISFLLDKIAVNFKHTTPDDIFPDFRDDTIVFYHSFQPRDIPNYIPNNAGKPYFWFIHTMGMHNLAFGKDCQYQHPVEVFGRNPQPQCPKTLHRGCGEYITYREQLSCMLSQLKFAIDEIIKRDPEAIIVVQGDHGSSINNDFRKRPPEQWTEKDVHEVFSILNIIRCPKDCQAMLYNDITSVNTFRVIFSYLDDKKYELLPDVSYIGVYKNWYPGADNPYFVDGSFKKHVATK